MSMGQYNQFPIASLVRQTTGLHRCMENSAKSMYNITNNKDMAIQENERNKGCPYEDINDVWGLFPRRPATRPSPVEISSVANPSFW